MYTHKYSRPTNSELCEQLEQAKVVERNLARLGYQRTAQIHDESIWERVSEPRITEGLFDVYVTWTDEGATHLRIMGTLWEAERLVEALWA